MVTKLLLYSLFGFARLRTVHAEPTLPPTLKLPWGVYEGQPMADDPEIYLFENVRFGANPPRFGAPAFPTTTNSSVQPVSDGLNCIQIDPSDLSTAPGGRSPIGTPNDQGNQQGEDCLFLDLYVPKIVIDTPPANPLPVVVWIYGGAFAFGSKNQLGPLYTGQSVIAASNYQTIFIAGNYRLGAFGWLSGDYMQKNGQPNAGLYDQALLFEWVQKYISQVSGDASKVSAWGESAGAGSILHHLVREDGVVDPTFKTFAVQSPAFEWAWDNSPMGTLDQVYQNFSYQAGCGLAFNLTCLQQSTNLTEANLALFANVKQTGLFPVGPAVDDKWVTTIPTISFANGKYWNSSIRSTIISHCLNETASFTPPDVTSSDTFTGFLETFFPEADLEPQRQDIANQYPCTKPPYNGDYRFCIATVIRDASFTCNTRDLYSAYPTISHMMQYAFPTAEYAHHASDLLTLFANNKTEAVDILMDFDKNLTTTEAGLYADALVGTQLARAYQTYFASFAVSVGNPNALPRPKVKPVPLLPGWTTPDWPVADGSEDALQNVLKVREPAVQPFKPTSDDQNTQTACAFWTKIANEIVKAQKARFVAKGREKGVDFDEL
ncbi:carboxylesterase family protein [Colletotrichum scovillei]|uniref:Carboxylesterase family protein n=1 Tax=Colletotrichum scovillei TaxID=1209932 RepID=A0A9P7QS65_9PEZI|nr:carboxylesterase family protein [Colletotrichum scovillei]KAG7041588.1 carboxylesterase family protein [Colletotrichum scovillei]KAG7061614.1 carboxylesterase family protein [Colletotrichum scovillei]